MHTFDHAADLRRRAPAGPPPARLHGAWSRPGRPEPARDPSPPAAHAFSRISVHAEASPRVFPRLAASTPGDATEREAERVADEVTRTSPARGAGGCAGCGDASVRGRVETGIQRAAAGAGVPVPEGVAAGIGALDGRGRALSRSERDAFEPRFGFDFGRVRVHDDAGAGRLAREVGARAFTVGSHIAFAPGEFAPATPGGRRLLAHELTHVVQQGRAEPLGAGAGTAAVFQGTAGARLQRTPAAGPDPLCGSYVFATRKAEIQGRVDALKAAPDVETRLLLIQDLKWIRRCGSEAEKTEILALLQAGLGAEEAAAVWKASGTAFGGYRGTYPGYYGGAKSHLTGLGTTEVNAYDAFAYNPRTPDDTYGPKAAAAATAEAASIEATDLLYFYGHQYAQYNAPGAFANGSQTRFVDLSALAGKGDFSRVKLIVSTSCATCCKEAVDVFAPLFPNAVILGYRKSAPTEGDKVRDEFDAGIKGLKTPLLLDQPVDVAAIIGVWKSVVAARHGKEDERLPGYYQAGTVHYLEMGVWKSMPASDPANTCRKKGSHLEEAAH